MKTLRRRDDKAALPERSEVKARQIFLLTIILLSGFAPEIAGQTPTPSSTAQTQPETRADSTGSRTAEMKRAKDVQSTQVRRNSSTRYGVSLTDKDREAVSMELEDARRFGTFLEQEDTGFVRLYDASGCQTNTKILDVSDECPPNMRGRGVSYSFRQKKYQGVYFSDLRFNQDALQIVGLNVLGLLTDLGDAPLEKLSLESGGIRELDSFQPSVKPDEIKEQFRIAARGFRVGEFIYKTSLPLKENNTYALRVIAYQSKIMRRVGSFKVNVLGQDKRQDLVVALRVIRKHANGSVSLLWRELSRKSAPKLDLSKSGDEK